MLISAIASLGCVDGMLLYIAIDAGGSTQRLRLVLEDDGSETIEGVKQMIHAKQGTNVGALQPASPGLH